VYDATPFKDGVPNVSFALAKSKEEYYWVIMSPNPGSDVFMASRCDDYTMTKDSFFTHSWGLMFPKNSPYLEIFNNELVHDLLNKLFLTQKFPHVCISD
jgi:hypothetical protein